MTPEQESLYQSVQPLVCDLIRSALGMYERDQSPEMKRHALMLAVVSERLRAHCGLGEPETRQ